MGTKLGYDPALDGVRAISIALVLAFHLGVPWMTGGYLGVSVFFTLSGFLITSLLLSERESTGRIDVGAFYLRRLRRLLPAALVCLVGVSLLAGVGAFAARTDLRAGVLGAAFQVANWVALLGERSYADLFVAPSPVDHFWSLAIEEQFYWLWPLAIAGLTALTARRADSHRTVVAALTGAFIALSLSAVATALVLGGDAAYFASWSRFAEIIAGAVLAAVVARRSVPSGVAHLAAPCLGAILLLSICTPASGGWAYSGGLPLFALVSVGLIAGVQTDGPVRRLLSARPLPEIGRVSYGLYLFHWPVFTVLDAELLHQTGPALAAVRLAVTAAVTLVSFHLLELPVRRGRVLASRSRYLAGAAAALVGAAAAAAFFVPVASRAHRSSEPMVIGAALTPIGPDRRPPEPTVAGGATRLAPGVEPDVVPAAVTQPVRVIAVFGDSIADWLLRDAAPTFTRTDLVLVDAAVEGCDGVEREAPARGPAGEILPVPADCRDWSEAYPIAVESPALPIDVALLMVGNAPMVDRDVGGRWVDPCTSVDWYLTDLHARVTYLRRNVGSVVLALPSWGGAKASFFWGDAHLARMACTRTAMQSFATGMDIPTVDLAAELCPSGPVGRCRDLRETDGLHVDREDAPLVLSWLLDSLPR